MDRTQSFGVLWMVVIAATVTGSAGLVTAAHAQPAASARVAISTADCTAAKVGTSIPVASIGLPVFAVTLQPPAWHDATANSPAYCRVDGEMAPIDTGATARPIRFAVALPAAWNRDASQIGGGGMDGTVPDLNGAVNRGEDSLLEQGFATYGSDSGHQMAVRPGGPTGGPPRGLGAGAGGPGAGGPGGPGGPPPPVSDPAVDNWALNQEAMANLGYMQLKKTHDAAMFLIEKMYGTRPKWNYFFGTSQGGREALTAIERFPNDYDGVAANVPIVGFSSLMLAPELIRIEEKPLANWVTMAKVNAIRGEVMRQCDKLDGLVDGVINNYVACRAIFDMSQGDPHRNPWEAKRCPGNVDPNPADTSAAACLTDGQISTLELVYSHYKYATPLANGVASFGMWTPNTDPSGSGLIATVRYRGQEGAAPDAPMHRHLGILGVTGFLMQDLNANPLDYVEGGVLNQRRIAISQILDSTNPDLSVFYKHGGKLIVVIGTNDTLASPGAQLDYYQSVLDKMGRATVDEFARLWVLPQTTHGLTGSIYTTDGDGKPVDSAPIPNQYARIAILRDWVENNRAPGKSIVVTAGDRSLPMCSYPGYPKFVGGPATAAGSYTCATN